MRLLFLDENNLLLDSSATLSTLNSNWTMISEWVNIPVQTRIIQVELTGTRNSGSDNDSYFDDLFLRLGSESSECDEFIPVSTNEPEYTVQNLNVTPNLFSNRATVLISGIGSFNRIIITNSVGQKVFCPIIYNSDEIIIERGNLNSGLYFFQVMERNNLIGTGKFVINYGCNLSATI